MKFGQVVHQEMSFKDISYLELWQPFCTIYAIIEKGILRNNPVKLFRIWTNGSDGNAV